MLKEAKVSLTYLLAVTEEDLNLGSDYTDKEFKNAVSQYIDNKIEDMAMFGDILPNDIEIDYE
jgi:hypothetical protein